MNSSRRAAGLDRRHFLSLLGSSAALSVLPGTAFGSAASPAQAAATPPVQTPSGVQIQSGVPAPFTFLFLTDTHIQPELDAAHGVALAMRRARAVPADFAIQGGDHVFDALGVSRARAVQLFDLYGKTEQDLGLKVHHTLGNHDCFAVYTASGLPTTDPEYGKKMYSARFGPTYYTFDHKGHHFIVLDSIGITPDRFYEARIDDEQLAWLASDLARTPAGTPIIVITHIPLVTAVQSYTPPSAVAAHGNGFTNGPAAIKLLAGHNVLGVLQGHTHVNEVVDWHGVPFITSGAVCGNWWHGTRLGAPEGFTVVTVADGKLTARYEASGFKSVAPENT